MAISPTVKIIPPINEGASKRRQGTGGDCVVVVGWSVVVGGGGVVVVPFVVVGGVSVVGGVVVVVLVGEGGTIVVVVVVVVLVGLGAGDTVVVGVVVILVGGVTVVVVLVGGVVGGSIVVKLSAISFEFGLSVITYAVLSMSGALLINVPLTALVLLPTTKDKKKRQKSININLYKNVFQPQGYRYSEIFLYALQQKKKYTIENFNLIIAILRPCQNCN